MNNELFQQAKSLAAAGDFSKAAELYRQCLDDSEQAPAVGEIGLLYHQMGNCFTKQKSYYEAIEAYAQAAADDAYDACGSVNYNAGMAYAALRDWVNAVKHFEIAVSDRKYPTPYKAYLGMGNSLLKMGKSAEAGVAFREAALDEANPDPTKALLNLGVCFMSLGRPVDAVASYESALQFDMASEVRNKLYASLGQAYVACGQMQKAADAFEAAIADKTYFLSASASVDYQRAIAAVSQGTADSTAALPVITGDMSGLDVVADEGSYDIREDELPQDIAENYYFADAYVDEGDEVDNGERFFTATDDELEQWSRGVVKMERRRKGTGLKVVVGIIIVLLLALGACVFLYTQGFGYPTQETVVEKVLSDPKDSSLYANGITTSDINAFASLVPGDSTIKIDGVDKTMSKSTAYATLTTPQGGDVTYRVSLVRDMIGWKVADLDLYFASQQ